MLLEISYIKIHLRIPRHSKAFYDFAFLQNQQINDIFPKAKPTFITYMHSKIMSIKAYINF